MAFGPTFFSFGWKMISSGVLSDRGFQGTVEESSGHVVGFEELHLCYLMIHLRRSSCGCGSSGAAALEACSPGEMVGAFTKFSCSLLSHCSKHHHFVVSPYQLFPHPLLCHLECTPCELNVILDPLQVVTCGKLTIVKEKLKALPLECFGAIAFVRNYEMFVVLLLL